MDYLKFLGSIALGISFFLIVVSAFLLNMQQKSMEYQQAYETSQSNLKTQIEHYNELYSAQQELRAARHEMKNERIALLGLLEGHKGSEAIQYIRKKQSHLKSMSAVLDTGHPAIDAIVNAKINEAKAQDINIHYKMQADVPLLVEQLDMAAILANALDNALEAVSKSSNIDTDIYAAITNSSNYLSIRVENFTSEHIDEHLRTTKKDALNHGFGIKQMRMLALKYKGHLTADFDKSTRKFSLKILLKNQKI